MLSLYLFGFIGLVFWLKYLWSQRKWYLLSWKLPVPPGYPFVGNSLIFWDRDTAIEKIRCLREKYKATGGFWLGFKFVVYVYCPEDIQKVLNAPECLDKSELYRFAADAVGRGILLSPKEKWAKNRKLINPSFSHKVLLSFFPIFNEGLDILTAKFEEFVGTGDVTLYDYLVRFNLDIACKTTMGANLNSQNNENQKIFDVITSAKFITCLRAFSPWLQPDILFRLSKWFKVQQKVKAVIEEFVYGLIEKRYSKYGEELKNDVLEDSHVDSIKKNGNIFIDQALTLVQQKQFTTEDVFNESNTIFTAAFETTTTVMTYIIQCLAMFPEHQEKVIEEVRTIFPSDKFDVTFEDTKQMVYSEMVINETLRLFPGVPLIGRRTSCDYKLNERIVIPKDTDIIIDVINMQRDPDFWGPTAHTFDPMRFYDSRKSFHPYSYIPFSKGPRNCIGWRYAMFSMKIFMAKVFKKFRFTTSQKLEDLKLRMDITLVTVNDPVVRIHKIF